MSKRMLPAEPDAPALIRAVGMMVDWTLVGIGAVMVVLVFLNVIFHVLGRDIAWTIELCEFLMVWATFLGGASAARRGAHMTITEFLDKLHGRGRIAGDAAIQIVALGVLALLMWYGSGLVQDSWGNILTVLGWPMAFQYMALPVGSAATALFVANDLVLILRGKTPAERYGA